MEKKFMSPVYNVQRIPISKIRANSYNPNKVALPELNLLEKSIFIDGYTMPIVCYYLESDDYYEIVDGYHRFLVMKNSEIIAQRENNQLPVTIIDKPITERIASTIRHNRARGTHSIDSMVSIIKDLIEAGISDRWIIDNIGMDKNELLRLKQISGLVALFADNDFSKGWEEI
ncbi:IbrB-like domain-containing protein [Enterococcus faecium]